MKRIVAFSVALGLMLGASAFVGEAQAAKVIKIAGMKADKEPETLGMKKFGELLEKKSNGFYKVKVYPNSSLGKEDKYIADNRRGTIEMCATGTQVSAFHPAMAMMETPMMYDSYAHARRAIDDILARLAGEEQARVAADENILTRIAGEEQYRKKIDDELAAKTSALAQQVEELRQKHKADIDALTGTLDPEVIANMAEIMMRLERLEGLLTL